MVIGKDGGKRVRDGDLYLLEVTRPERKQLACGVRIDISSKDLDMGNRRVIIV